MLGFAVAALTATLVCRLGSAQTTVIGQFTGDANTWDDSTTNPCIGTTKTDEVMTVGPNLPEPVIHHIDNSYTCAFLSVRF